MNVWTPSKKHFKKQPQKHAKKEPKTDPKKHPDGKCIPCCFKNFNKTQETREQQCSGKTTEANNNEQIHVEYILSYDSFPMNNDRLGYLPPALARFLNVDYSQVINKSNPELLTNNIKTMLRIGSEQSNNKSFVGCLAEIHHTMTKPPGPKMSIDDFCDHIANSISIDDFLLYNPVWRKPFVFHFDDLKIITMGLPSSGGVVLSQILKSLEKKRNVTKEKIKNNFLLLLFKIPAIIKDRIQNVGFIKNDNNLDTIKNI